MAGAVEAVHIVDEELPPVLDVDVDLGLGREGVLGQRHVKKVARRDGRHVVSAGQQPIKPVIHVDSGAAIFFVFARLNDN